MRPSFVPWESVKTSASRAANQIRISLVSKRFDMGKYQFLELHYLLCVAFFIWIPGQSNQRMYFKRYPPMLNPYLKYLGIMY